MSPEIVQEADHWLQHARQWTKVGAPLRPPPEDIKRLECLTRDAYTAIGHDSFSALLLGVTPEIACMRWPTRTRLVAIDRCRAMIEVVWPRDRLQVDAQVGVGDWCNLPIPNDFASVVVGDGCYSMLVTSDDYRQMSAEVARALRPNGRFIVRLFVRPERKEATEAVFDDLRAGRIGNFHIFKWRLAMALPSNAEFGIRIGDIWEAWHNSGIEHPQVLGRLNWPLEVVDTIDTYRGKDAIYTFPPLSEMRRRLTERFNEIKTEFPDYEMGDRCPTLVLEVQS